MCIVRHVDDEAEEVEDNSSEIDPDVNEADVEEDVGFEDVEGSVIDVSDSEGSLVDFIADKPSTTASTLAGSIPLSDADAL